MLPFGLKHNNKPSSLTEKFLLSVFPASPTHVPIILLSIFLLSTLLIVGICSETERCVALLEDSASVLLHCLEMVDPAAVVRKCYFTWEVPEAVKCASFLRRIYEEVCVILFFDLNGHASLSNTFKSP